MQVEKNDKGNHKAAHSDRNSNQKTMGGVAINVVTGESESSADRDAESQY